MDLATAKHGRTIFTYICPATGKEFDVLGTMPDLPLGKIISERFEVGRAFCTKLWNAARFTLINLREHAFRPLALDELEPEDRWILSRLSRAIRRVSEGLAAYNPAAAIGAARDFFWGELCDWYLEFIKPRFQDPRRAAPARAALALALDYVLRLFHPFVPFITEVLWEELASQCPVRGLERPLEPPGLLIQARWPEPRPDWEDEKTEAEFRLAMDIVRAIRDLRSRYTISSRKKVEVLIKADGEPADILNRLQKLVLHLGNLSRLDVAAGIRRPATAATQVIGEMEVFIPGVIDPAKEREQLKSQRERLVAELAKVEARLQNENFISRAPAGVVAGEKSRLEDLRAEIALVDKHLQSLQ
ncbi:MAG: class I tRNA ligase family protein [Candidatus Aminicenantes bacterium]|nr:class I tRNA ligase family protein [Candidatus Aminicenantes bacterium]